MLVEVQPDGVRAVLAEKHIEEDHKVLKQLFDMHVEDREYPGFCEECCLGWPCRTRRVLIGKLI
jgi:hypothetical protein